jgi:hypothetical protein
VLFSGIILTKGFMLLVQLSTEAQEEPLQRRKNLFLLDSSFE